MPNELIKRDSVFPSISGSFWENWDSLWDDLDSLWLDSWFNVPSRRAFSYLDVKDDRYELKYELPGVEPSEISVDRAGGVLTIRAEQVRKETGSFFSFEKSMTLPKDADVDKIEADLRSGVLRLTIPRVKLTEKKEEPVKIDVKSGDEPTKIETKT